ncbi:hypothetical protein FH972_019337 [Carpinus fangiana]|uniref:Uncharacterized protein n=1 Tax=Carpinus fangiana TaxID=176857 RepID=A0A5N6RTC7_9ROSI|nr:hypothetical protein FH972_019337 [Carpinus fangiana]
MEMGRFEYIYIYMPPESCKTIDLIVSKFMTVGYSLIVEQDYLGDMWKVEMWDAMNKGSRVQTAFQSALCRGQWQRRYHERRILLVVLN